MEQVHINEHTFPKSPYVTRISKMKIFPLTKIKFHLHFDGLFGCNRSAISSFRCNIYLMALYKPKRAQITWSYGVIESHNWWIIYRFEQCVPNQTTYQNACIIMSKQQSHKLICLCFCIARAGGDTPTKLLVTSWLIIRFS